MNRKLLSAVGVAATFIFVASTIAQAADIKFSGQIRPRWEYQDRDFNDATDGNTVVDGRVRLNALADIDEKTSAFIQMQAIRTWGDPVLGNGAEVPNDQDTSVGLHQGFFTIKDLYNLPVDLKFGRQEFILDGHRLFGDTLWTPGEQSHDGVRLTHSAGNHTLVYFMSRNLETSSSENNLTDNDTDTDVHVFYGQFKGILGGALSLQFSYLNDDSLEGTAGASDNDIYTAGFRQAGTLGGIKYRGEFYYQWGDSEANGTGWERDAYLFGVRAGKAFGGAMKPVVTLMFDYVSGTDAGDISSKDNASFDTLFDTGHKFYGFMDHFLNMGTTSRTATAGSGGSNVQSDNVNGLGLMDFAVKGMFDPRPNLHLGAHLHFFWTAEDAFDSANRTYSAGNVGESHIGEELDITLTHNYNPSTNIVFGYSHFFADDLVRDLNMQFSRAQGSGAGNNPGDDADWAYVMVDVQF
jgi:hypothetical protein